jgi:phospholipid/cholesterol/gamma-HCH transport system permease protein
VEGGVSSPARTGGGTASALLAPVRGIGRTFADVSSEAGGIVILALRIIRRFFPPDIDVRELKRHLYAMGNRSVLVVAFSSFFVGVTMVVQATILVQELGAYSLVGWGSAYIVLRELGPVFVALMFSGRVGANNTADLGTMVITEQVDGLRALSIDPISFLIVPRVIAMIIMCFILTIVGNTVAMTGAALMADLMLDVDIYVFWKGVHDLTKLSDMWLGLQKSLVFGSIIAMSSCFYGLNVKGGAPGVGRAVNASVVTSAVGILIGDYILTFLIG